jgi:hypothetical protein
MTPREVDVDGLFERNADTRLLDRRRSEELGLPPVGAPSSTTTVQFGPESMLSAGAPLTAPRGPVLRVALQARPDRELIPGAVVTLVAEVHDDGDTDADDVRLRIAIPPETEAIGGSFVRDDVELDGESLLGEGLRIGTVAAATSIRIRFAVRVLPGTEPIDVLAYAGAPGVPALAAPALRLTRRSGHVAYDAPRAFFELEAGELDGDLGDDEEPAEPAAGDPLNLVDTVVDEAIPFGPLTSDLPPLLPEAESHPPEPDPDVALAPEPEIEPAPEIAPEPEIAPAPEIAPEPEIAPVAETAAEPEIAPIAQAEATTAAAPEIEIAPDVHVTDALAPEIASEPEVALEPEAVSEAPDASEPEPEQADAVVAPVVYVLARALDADELRALERVFAGAVPHGLAALALLSSIAAVDTPLGSALGVRDFSRSVAAALPRALVAARMNRPTPPVVTPETLASIRARGTAPNEPLGYAGALLVTRLDERELDALRAVLGRELDDPFLRGVQVLLAVAPRALDGVGEDATPLARDALNAYRVAAGGWLMRVTVRRAVDRKYDPLTADDASLHAAGRALVATLRDAIA